MARFRARCGSKLQRWHLLHPPPEACRPGHTLLPQLLPPLPRHPSARRCARSGSTSCRRSAATGPRRSRGARRRMSGARRPTTGPSTERGAPAQPRRSVHFATVMLLSNCAPAPHHLLFVSRVSSYQSWHHGPPRCISCRTRRKSPCSTTEPPLGQASATFDVG